MYKFQSFIVIVVAVVCMHACKIMTSLCMLAFLAYACTLANCIQMIKVETVHRGYRE